MHENIFKIYKARLERFVNENQNLIYREWVPLEAECAVSDEPVRFADREKGSFRKITEGEVWGHEWQSAWFHLRGSVPESFAGRELCLCVHTGGEMLIFDKAGVPAYGLTGFSVFDQLYCKYRYVIGSGYKGGDTVEYWAEAAANGLFGIDLPAADEVTPEHPLGSFHPEIKRLRLCVFDRVLWDFLLDFETAYWMMVSYGENYAYGKRLLYQLNQVLALYNCNPANAKICRDFMQKNIMIRPANASALTACTIGHAHIDVGWLWPVRESTRKAARTFSSQLALMEKYPDYKFGASQAHLYKVVKENYPELFEKIRARVKEGRWEVQGGMWVEADCNLISGESMVRQFLHAKNFFMDEFGVNVRNLWIPDVFGYSASMPQIMKKAGCDYFLTQKISWSQVNKFPYNTFRWIGVDGSEVITHFPPENTYNALSRPDGLIPAANRFNEAGFLDEFMSLIGIGDGGGGPSEDYVEHAERLKNLEGAPKVKFDHAQAFFDRLEKHRSELPKWVGELYLEYHRGTLTTQAHTKRNNRKCEQALTALEILASCLPRKEYPAAMLDRSWKMLLLNQFHDIIPGSSINQVYAVTEKQHQQMLAEIKEEMSSAAEKLFCKDESSIVLVNTLSWTWNGLVTLPEGWDSAEGYSVQNENGVRRISVTIPADSFLTIRKGTKTAENAVRSSDRTLENEYLRCSFAEDGTLSAVYDKENNREVLCGKGNLMSFYNDRPITYEAWDIDIFYRDELIGHPECVSMEKTAGPVCESMTMTYHFRDSVIRQKVELRCRSRRLDFITHVDWKERRTLFRTEFPTTVTAEEALFDIQYAAVKRNTHDNTSWDQAKFETCGQRYADLSGRDYGVALLNDCKYGYRIRGSVIDLALLRSPTHPDHFADLGEHDFTYSLYPHAGEGLQSSIYAEAASLNRAPLMFPSMRVGNALFPVSVESGNVSLEIIKKAEKDDSLIVRLVETRGEHSSAVLCLRPDGKVSETDLMEWQDSVLLPVCDGKIRLEFKPFEIRTFRIK